MIRKLTHQLTDIIIASGSGKEESRDVYVYGLDIILSTILNLVCVCIFSLIVGRFVFAIIYMIFFVGLRTVAGGYHANTHLGCLLVMLAAFGLSLLLLYVVPTMYYLWISFVMIVLSASLIFTLAPVDHPNKPLDKEDKKRLKALSRSVISLEMALIAGCWVVIPHLDIYIMAATLGMVTSALSCGAVVIINKIREGASK